MRPNRAVVAALAGSAVLVVGGGTAALAAVGGHPANQTRCDARLATIAQKRGTTVAELQAQVKARLLARVDAALQAGRISAERAAALKARIAGAEFCHGGLHPLVSHGLHGMLKAAADFLHLTEPQLRAQLPGTSLAALAQHQGKSTADLEAAMIAGPKAKLAHAVAAGHIKQVRADHALTLLTTRAHRLASKTFPPA